MESNADDANGCFGRCCRRQKEDPEDREISIPAEMRTRETSPNLDIPICENPRRTDSLDALRKHTTRVFLKQHTSVDILIALLLQGSGIMAALMFTGWNLKSTPFYIGALIAPPFLFAVSLIRGYICVVHTNETERMKSDRTVMKIHLLLQAIAILACMTGGAITGVFGFLNLDGVSDDETNPCSLSVQVPVYEVGSKILVSFIVFLTFVEMVNLISSIYTMYRLRNPGRCFTCF